jgi:hypothetical protein
MDPEHLMVTLNIPNQLHIFPTFHMSQILPFMENDTSLFPSRELENPPPIIIDNEEEYFIDHILDKH